MAFTNEFKEQVKSATDLKELIEEYTTLKKTGDNVWSGRCPHPDHRDSSPSFRLFMNKPGDYTWKCFGCQDPYAKKGEHGNYGSDCFAFIQWINDYNGSTHKVSFNDSIRILAERASIQIPIRKEHRFAYKRNEMLARAAYSNQLPQVREYLYSRGLDKEDIRRWKIGFRQQREGKLLVNRIVFPLMNRFGKCVGFSNRSFNESDDVPKYWNSPKSDIFDKGNFFFGEQFIDDFEELRITEGQFDVILSTKFGAKNVVATLGTAFTEKHVFKCKYLHKYPVFIFDGDEAGAKGIRRAVERCVSKGIPSKVCILPKNKDLAEISIELGNEIEEWIQSHSIPAWEYQLWEPTIAYEAGVQELRMKALPALREAAAYPMTKDEKTLFTSLVKERFGIVL